MMLARIPAAWVEYGQIVADVLGLVLGAVLLLAPSAKVVGLAADVRRWCRFSFVWLALTASVTAVGLHLTFATLNAIAHAIAHVAAPLAVARGLQRVLTARDRAGWWGIGVGVSVLGVYLWSCFVEPRRLAVTIHRVESPRAASVPSGLRVVLLADIQTDRIGEYESSVLDRVKSLEPDLVLLAGDYVQIGDKIRFAAEAARFRELFARYEPWPRLGMYAVIGDIDPDPRIFDGTRVRLLDDESVDVGGESMLQIVGLSLPSSRRSLDDSVRSSIAEFSGFSIVLGHAPDFMLDAIAGTAAPDALLLAGHTHGGQVVVPGFGPPITLTAVPRAIAAGGLHRYGAAQLCVSRGIGMERGLAPRIRFWCPPEIVVFDFGR
ncbi:MAG: metallophosphoesterase [Planctomycetota bacterium]